MAGTGEEREELMHRVAALRVPPDFSFGAALCAYQVEGAADLDGKGESIWDRFSHRPGAIRDGSHGDRAADHYHLFGRDIDLARQLGLDALRLSLSWPRLFAKGSGPLNRAGAAHYDRVIDAVLEAGLQPRLALYHWDLPQALQVKGGWSIRDTAMRFADYAATAASLYGDRVAHWTTLADPWTFSWAGHATGEHAPGLEGGVAGALSASHHALFAHGLAVPLIRAEARQAEIGISLRLDRIEPSSDREPDVEAARRRDGAQNRWYLEALFKGAYPRDMIELFGERRLPRIDSGDLEAIAADIDVLDIAGADLSLCGGGRDLAPLDIRWDGADGRGPEAGSDGKNRGRVVEDLLLHLHHAYAPRRLTLTGSGKVVRQDLVDRHGRIDDIERASLHVARIEGISAALQKGAPVTGYMADGLIDGFGWTCGHDAPAGLVHVDRKTLERRVKWSGELYARIAGEAARA